jgi:hypothetical protein
MTKLEFLTKVPGIINHEAHGHGELEIVVDSLQKKGVCYRHKDNTASCGTYAASFAELFDKFSGRLKTQGYMKN